MQQTHRPGPHDQRHVAGPDGHAFEHRMGGDRQWLYHSRQLGIAAVGQDENIIGGDGDPFRQTARGMAAHDAALGTKRVTAIVAIIAAAAIEMRCDGGQGADGHSLHPGAQRFDIAGEFMAQNMRERRCIFRRDIGIPASDRQIGAAKAAATDPQQHLVRAQYRLRHLDLHDVAGGGFCFGNCAHAGQLARRNRIRQPG